MDELNNIFGGAEQLWYYIKKYAKVAGREATRIVLELYYVLKSPDTPVLDKTIIISALGYQLLPNDLISRKKAGLLGLLDNGAALAVAYSRTKKRVTPEIEIQVNSVLNQWFGYNEVDGYHEGETTPDYLQPQIPEAHIPNNISEPSPSSTAIAYDNDFDDVIID